MSQKTDHHSNRKPPGASIAAKEKGILQVVNNIVLT
jgi:hypothetical protein